LRRDIVKPSLGGGAGQTGPGAALSGLWADSLERLRENLEEEQAGDNVAMLRRRNVAANAAAGD